jgi:hypothetical protein
MKPMTNLVLCAMMVGVQAVLPKTVNNRVTDTRFHYAKHFAIYLKHMHLRAMMCHQLYQPKLEVGR